MSFNISIPGFKKKTSHTSTATNTIKTRRTKTEEPAEKTPIESMTVKAPPKSSKQREKVDRLINNLLRQLQNQQPNPPLTQKLVRQLAEAANSPKVAPHLRDWVKGAAKNLPENTWRTVLDNIELADLSQMKGGEVYLVDIYETVKSLDVIAATNASTQPQPVEQFVVIQYVPVFPAPYVPQIAMPPAQYVPQIAMPPAPHVPLTAMPPPPHVPVNVTYQAPFLPVVVTEPKEQSKRLAYNLVAAVLRGDDVAAAARALERHCFSAHPSSEDRSRAMGALINEAVDNVGSEGRLTLRAILPENRKQTGALAMLTRLLATQVPVPVDPQAGQN